MQDPVESFGQRRNPGTESKEILVSWVDPLAQCEQKVNGHGRESLNERKDSHP